MQGSGKLSHSRNFTEAGYYYCEIVSINTGGKAYFKLMWDTPKLNTASPANPTWQIDYFSVTPADILPEIINVTVNTALLGSDSFHLFYYINNGGIFTLQSSKAITAKISAAAFQDKLSTLYTLANYDPVVTLQTFTSAWVADSSAAATIYQYSISLAKWRDTATYNIPLTEPAV